ncbi:amino acid permease [Corynebacterium frankenforstense]|uniref:amino acid permease n=1 Tax=Corynebacterium frankenforstense TaxID=1230998 RepID=UPI0026EDAE75|nr:amino acid permease [Corynebacterium frankenforstense]
MTTTATGASGAASQAATATSGTTPAGAASSSESAQRGVSTLRNRHVTMIALGGIVGSALFIGSGNVIRSIGPAAILSYLLGGLLVYLAMKMLGEMAAARPSVGSFMDYARDGLGPFASYLVGWLYWYFWVGVLAYDAVIGGETLHGWFPAIPAWAGSLAVIALVIVANAVSVRGFGETEFWLASVKVVAVFVFLGAGTLYVLGLWPGAGFSVPNLWEHGGFAPNGYTVALSGMAVVIFAYFGTEIAVMAAAESEDPGPSVRRATNTVIWRILLFFIGSITLIAAIVPWNQLPDPTDVATAPFTYVLHLFGVPGAAQIMGLVIFTAVLSVLNSGLYSASRMLSAMGAQGFAPPVLARRNARGVPVPAIFASILGALFAVGFRFVFPETPIFEFIMNSSGLVALVVYAMIACTHFAYRRRMSREEVRALEFRTKFFPLINLLVVVGVAVVFVIMIADPGSQVQVWTSLVAIAFAVAAWPIARGHVRRREAAQAEAAEAADAAAVEEAEAAQAEPACPAGGEKPAAG